MQSLARLVPLLFLLSAPVAGAQGIVRGVLFDSLRTGEPIPNATIIVDGRRERTRTDARGRFRFTSLPVGAYTLRYQMPWLDSLALPPITGRAEVCSAGTGYDVALTTPSLFARAGAATRAPYFVGAPTPACRGSSSMEWTGAFPAMASRRGAS